MKKLSFATHFLPALALTALLAVPASAQEEVEFEGYTNGCFGAACVPVDQSAPQSDQLAPGLFYYNAIFDVQTVNGMAGFGSTAQQPPNQNVDNLGSFHLTSPGDYSGLFTLAVRFTMPSLTNPSQFFDAEISGSVDQNAEGGVFINWFQNQQTFDFMAASGNRGTATLTVNPTSINPGQGAGATPLVPVTGQITATVVPEPASMILLATGLVGLGVAVRRSRNGVDLEGEDELA